jgi:hypothetical protein
MNDTITFQNIDLSYWDTLNGAFLAYTITYFNSFHECFILSYKLPGIMGSLSA